MSNIIEKIKNDVVACLMTNDSIVWQAGKNSNSCEFVSSIYNYNIRLDCNRSGEYVLIVTKNNECCGKVISDTEFPDIKILYKNVSDKIQKQRDVEYWKNFYETLKKV